MIKTGELLALITAICWTVTSLSFEAAGKRVGTLALNLIRLIIAFIFIGIYSIITNGSPIPLHISLFTWKWLLLSGFIGFVLGDFFLFKAYIYIGARISMLLMALAPIFAAFIGFFLLGETLGLLQLTGMAVTMTGIAIVIAGHPAASESKIDTRRRFLGIVYAIIGALGQGGGLVISKYGIADTNPFVATQIRIIAGIVGFVFIIIASRKIGNVVRALRDKPAIKFMLSGAFFGPFLGVSFSLAAVQYTSTGIVSTITSIVPVLLIIPAVFIFHEKIKFREIVGAGLSIVGVGMLFF